jgi:hypothetical protein
MARASANVFITNSGTGSEAAGVVLSLQTLGGSPPPPSGGPVITLTSSTASQGTLPQLTNNSSPSAHQGKFSSSNSTNVLTVTGPGTGNYVAAFANTINNGNGDGNDYVQVNGFNPAKDAPEVYALKLDLGGTYLNPANSANTSVIAAIINDINNANSSTFGANIASTVSGIFAPVFSGYDVLLTFPSGYITGLTPGTPAEVDFGFDFTGYSDTTAGIATGSLTTTDIGVIPEPASIGMMMLGGLGLLGRRKRKD